MAAATSSPFLKGGLRALTPRERIVALADDAPAFLDVPRPSPHVARFGITATDDDGIVTAALALDGARVLMAAQDERFLGGSVGARHADALRALFERALAERPAAVVLLLASGGVRLHEANAAELALARALQALFTARSAGIVVVGLAVGDVFGGASILACAGERLGLQAHVRIGLSGPRLVESAGPREVSAADRARTDEIFRAHARAAAGDADLVADDAAAVRAWIRGVIAAPVPFAAHVLQAHAALAARATPTAPSTPVPEFLARLAGARAVDAGGWLWRAGDVLVTRPFSGVAFGAPSVHELDAALLSELSSSAAGNPRAIIVTEDSTGHEVSRAAESRFESRHLALHAAVLALLRDRGHRLTGLLCGIGHSAAFFANALQAPRLLALDSARVIAMDPASVARVTGLDVAALIEIDPLLGQPVRHLAALGGVEAIMTKDEAARRILA